MSDVMHTSTCQQVLGSWEKPPSHSNSSWQDCVWFVARVLSLEPNTWWPYTCLCTVYKITYEYHVCVEFGMFAIGTNKLLCLEPT